MVSWLSWHPSASLWWLWPPFVLIAWLVLRFCGWLTDWVFVLGPAWLHQRIKGVPVRLIGGPCDGQTVAAFARGGGIPDIRITFTHRDQSTDEGHYWRRRHREPDGSWVAEFHPGPDMPPELQDELFGLAGPFGR